MLQFYMTPGSCSTGIHILLEELEQVFAVNIVDLQAGDHLKDTYKQMNPKCTIPMLVRPDGIAICDYLAIAWWLANTFPKAGLLPEKAGDIAECIELINYVTSTIHGQGFARIFTYEKFVNDGEDKGLVIEKGRAIVEQGFDIIEQKLNGNDEYALGHFSIADSALFYVLFWADRTDMILPPKCLQLYQKMLTRGPVRQVLLEEGYRFHLN